MNFKKFTTLTFTFLCLMSISFGQTVFLEEQFNGGLPATWNSVEVRGDGAASASWTYTTTGAAGNFPIAAIASTTAANGWMIFDSDLNCSGEQEAWLISPQMTINDLSSVWLVFESFYRSYNDRPQIRIGNDMGDLASWETVEVFPGILRNEYESGIEDGSLASNPVEVQMNLSDAFQAVGGTDFFLAFEFLSDGTTDNGGSGGPGCAYAWNIDDVLLSDEDPREAVNMRMNPFFAIAKNVEVPASQVEPVGFLADISNLGSMTIPASTVTVNVVDADSGMNVFTTSKSYGEIAPDSTAENQVIGDSFTPPATPAIYNVTYTVEPDGMTDTDLSNNEQSYTFIVGDTTFQKSQEPYVGISAVQDVSYTLGNVYYVPNGEGLWARYLTFGFTNASDLAGESVTTLLYEWDGDTNGDDQMNISEVTGGGPVVFNAYTFDGTEDDQALTIPIDSDLEGFPLSNDKHYVLVMQFVSSDGEKECLMMAGANIDYGATGLLMNDELEIPEYTSAFNSGTDPELSVGFTTLIPLMKMSIGTMPITANENPLLPEGAVTLFPNPVSTAANFEFDLENASDVEVKVYDITGKLVRTSEYDNIQHTTIAIETQSLLSGNYLVRINTDEGISTIKMAVQH